MATVWDAANKDTNLGLFAGATVAAGTSNPGNWKGVRGTTSFSTGKKYIEFYGRAYGNDNGILFGFGNSSFNTASYPGSNGNSFGFHPSVGATYGLPSGIQSDLPWGVTFSIAIDLDAKLVWYRTDKHTNWNNSGTANPATGTGGFAYTVAGALFPAVAAYDGAKANQLFINAGGYPFLLTAPSGFTAWDTGVPARNGKLGSTSAFDPGNKDTHVALTNSNLTAEVVNPSVNAPYCAKSNNAYGSGRIYFELTAVAWASGTSFNGTIVGPSDSARSNTVNPGADYTTSGLQIGSTAFGGFTGAYINGVRTLAASTFDSSPGDKIGFAFDFDTGKWWAKNVTTGSNWNGVSGADPVTGANSWPMQSVADYMYFQWSGNGNSGAVRSTINFGASLFLGAIPTGFTRWDALGTTGAAGLIAGTSSLVGASRELHRAAGTILGTSSLVGVGSSVSRRGRQAAVTIIT